jgi:hypothetical protein
MGESVLSIGLLSGMVIGDLNVSGLVGDPFKADASLVIDADAVLPGAVVTRDYLNSLERTGAKVVIWNYD